MPEIPFVSSCSRTCCCAESACAAQRRSCSSLATPPAAWTRCASDGARMTTIMRWPSATGERADPTSPCQLSVGVVCALGFDA